MASTTFLLLFEMQKSSKINPRYEAGRVVLSDTKLVYKYMVRIHNNHDLAVV